MSRRPRPENIQQRQAYEAYLAQPTPRRINKLAADIGVPWRTLFEWQRRFNWRERALLHDRKAIDAALAEKEEAREQQREQDDSDGPRGHRPHYSGMVR